MHNHMNVISMACGALDLTINLIKAVVKFLPTSGIPYIEPGIFLYRRNIFLVSKFVCLRDTLNKPANIDDVQKASFTFIKLEDRVCSRFWI